MILPMNSLNTFAPTHVTQDLVRALCSGATVSEIKLQGSFVYKKVNQERKKAFRTKLGYIPSDTTKHALLYDSESPVEASDFEVARRLLGEPRLLAEALAFSPSTHPLIALTAITIDEARDNGVDPPLWVATQAHPLLAAWVAQLASGSSEALRSIQEPLEQILPLARNGKKFQAGRKTKRYAPLRKWILAHVTKYPHVKNEEVWQALAKAKPAWIEAPHAKLAHREVWIGNDLAAQWPYFRNLVALCKKELRERLQQ